MKRAFAPLLLSALSSVVIAQNLPNQQLTSSFDLIQQGRPETAVAILTTAAGAPDYDAGLQVLKGNPDLARKLLHQAAAITAHLQNHVELSSILVHLAGL